MNKIYRRFLPRSVSKVTQLELFSAHPEMIGNLYVGNQGDIRQAICLKGLYGLDIQARAAAEIMAKRNLSLHFDRGIWQDELLKGAQLAALDFDPFGLAHVADL